jgi:hypothetical protein
MPSNSSFIDANGLTPQQLAALLQRLAANRTEYDQYFLFKRQPLPRDFVQMALNSYVRLMQLVWTVDGWTDGWMDGWMDG